jgi:hypothetical protein
MSILARLAQLSPTIDGVMLPPGTAPRSEPEQNLEEPTVETIEQIRIASQGAAAEAGEITEPAFTPPETTVPPVDLNEVSDLDDDIITGKTVVSTQEIIKGGRRVLLTIYSDGSTDEQDLGPSSEPPPPPPPPGPVVEVPGDPVEEFDAKAYVETNYPWLGPELSQGFLQEFNTNGGDEEEALRVLRTTQAYKDKFPGIFREDGKTLRIDTPTPELDYIKIEEDYTNLLADYNLNPDYFSNQIQTLFENDVAPRTFEERLNVAYNSLFPQFGAVKQYYVNNYPNIFPTTEDITDEAIFASFISEDVSADIINQRVEVSQIGGAFLEQDFAISTEQAQRLISAGVSGTGAQQLAARAETQLPRLQRLASRFTGREDIFGLSEFIESEVFGDGVADQVRARLEGEQATVFTQEGGAAATQAGITGLVEQ